MNEERRYSGDVSRWRFVEHFSHCEVRKAGESFHHLPAKMNQQANAALVVARKAPFGEAVAFRPTASARPDPMT